MMIWGVTLLSDTAMLEIVHQKPRFTYPMDPVPSERKWDWGIIYDHLESYISTFLDSGHGSIGILNITTSN